MGNFYILKSRPISSFFWQIVFSLKMKNNILEIHYYESLHSNKHPYIDIYFGIIMQL